MSSLHRTILLVDDHQILRTGLRQILGGQWEICGEAENGQEAVEKALSLKPDLIVMDISMPVVNGLEATKQIRHLGLPTKIAILSMHDSDQVAKQAEKAGADAFLTKTCSPNELVNRIAGLLDTNKSTTTAFCTNDNASTMSD